MDIRENIEKVRQQIVAAAQAAGRNADEIRLVAVSKTKPPEMVAEAIACGVMDFGENRPQELSRKYADFPNARWHQIGQLQRNKVKHIIDKAALIHSVDSLLLAEEIEKQAAKIQKIQNILIQVNITGEETKSGVSPGETVALCRAVSTLSHVRILGLMTISAAGYSATENGAVFRKLKELSAAIEKERIPGVLMQELSMGMTHDFQAAITAGATMVRVGSGIFGARNIEAVK